MTVKDIAAAVHGVWWNPREDAPAVTAVCTDSRKITPGCLFLPWVGEKFDGHDFIDAALDAGAAGIIVSNHGGRVLDDTPATAWVLPQIAKTVGDNMMVLVDGGIRTGLDIFKAIALGADAVLIGRPFAACIYGAGTNGIAAYISQLEAELSDTMRMCGPRRLSEISREHIWQK